MTASYRIEELKSLTSQVINDLPQLIRLLLPERKISANVLSKIIDNANCFIFIAINNDGGIIGVATMTVCQTLTVNKAVIDDVIVDANYRRIGIGRALMNEIIKKSKELNIESIHLTSRPCREGANILYKKLGFKQYETNYYKYDLTKSSQSDRPHC